MLKGTEPSEFDSNDMLCSATQYLLIVIGEACVKLQTASLEEMPEVPIDKVRGFRNRLVHGYFDVDLVVIWSVATDHVPVLANAAESALRKLFPETYSKLQERRKSETL